MSIAIIYGLTVRTLAQYRPKHVNAIPLATARDLRQIDKPALRLPSSRSRSSRFRQTSRLFLSIPRRQHSLQYIQRRYLQTALDSHVTLAQPYTQPNRSHLELIDLHLPTKIARHQEQPRHHVLPP